MTAITVEATPAIVTDLPQLAVTLRARLDPEMPLTPGERLLLDEPPARLANQASASAE